MRSRRELEKRSKELTGLIMPYLERLKGQDFANRTLARKVVDENPHFFDGITREKAIENVRGFIRLRRGAKFADQKSKTTKKYIITEFVREEMKPSEYMAQFMKKGETTSKPTWHLPSHLQKVLVLSDIHIPYHHLESVNAALDYGFKEGIDSIYINGDLVDFADISRFAKDRKVRSVQEEIDLTFEFLSGLSELGVSIFYKCGNHDYRLNRFLAANAPQLMDIEEFTLQHLLRLEDMGIEFIHDKQFAKFGKLNVVHGHEFGDSIFSPVNPARGLFLRAKSSTLAGHNHQTSTHHENNLNGDPIVCYSTGCLCDLRPDYRPAAYTKWNHGAAIVEVEKNGNFTVDNFRIIDGKVR